MKKKIIGLVGLVMSLGLILTACAIPGLGGFALNGKWEIVSLGATEKFQEKYKDGVENENVSEIMVDTSQGMLVSYAFAKGSIIEFEGNKVYVAGGAAEYETNGSKLEIKGAGSSGSSSDMVFDYTINGNTLEMVYDNKYIITLERF